jgi:hypothetical protein
MIVKWYPTSAAPRDGTPVILWIEDDQAPPYYPVTVGAWTRDDVSGTGYWRVFGGRYGTHSYFDHHIRGWVHLPLPRDA